MSAITRAVNACAPRQVLSSPRPKGPHSAVDFHARAAREAAGKIAQLLEQNPGRAYLPAEIAARLELTPAIVREVLSTSRRSKLIVGVPTENRGAGGKWRYRWRDVPA